jgi:hypothetical protein
MGMKMAEGEEGTDFLMGSFKRWREGAKEYRGFDGWEWECSPGSLASGFGWIWMGPKGGRKKEGGERTAGRKEKEGERRITSVAPVKSLCFETFEWG